MNILALASWYPSKKNFYNGDFVQRHLHAFSKHAKISLLHIIKDNNINKKYIIDFRKINDNLEEIIVYYKSDGKTIFFPKTLSTIKFWDIGRKISKVLFERVSYDQVHVHVCWRMILLGRELAIRHKKPFFIFEHNTELLDFPRSSHWKRMGSIQYVITFLGLRSANKIFCVSNALKDSISKNFAKKSKISVLSNVVNTDFFNYSPKLKSDITTFLHISSCVKFKRVDRILRAFHKLNKQYPNTKLIIIGKKNTYLELILGQLNLHPDNFEFKSEIHYSLIAQQLQNANYLVMASDYETQSCVSIESMCCGTPVIAPNHFALKEIITTDNGIKLPNNTTEQIFIGMEKALNAKFDHEKISQEAIAKYNYNNVANQFIHEISN